MPGRRRRVRARLGPAGDGPRRPIGRVDSSPGAPIRVERRRHAPNGAPYSRLESGHEDADASERPPSPRAPAPPRTAASAWKWLTATRPCVTMTRAVGSPARVRTLRTRAAPDARTLLARPPKTRCIRPSSAHPSGPRARSARQRHGHDRRRSSRPVSSTLPSLACWRRRRLASHEFRRVRSDRDPPAVAGCGPASSATVGSMAPAAKTVAAGCTSIRTPCAGPNTVRPKPKGLQINEHT